jgi:methionyl aminopeptidase
MIIQLKSPAEIEKLYRADQVVAEALASMAEAAAPGVSTALLDEIARKIIEKRKAKSAFLGYPNPSGGAAFPATVCASVNDVVVHGIPSADMVLKSGDILSLDFGVILDGWCGDAALTVAIGDIRPEAKRLMDTTRECLEAAIEQSRLGKRVGDIGHAVQALAESRGYGVVHEFVGHGIGKKMHEPPAIPNLGTPGTGERIRVGMTFAIEPMINMVSPDVKVDADGWTARTADGEFSAHFEHSIAVTPDGPRVLSRIS